MSVIITAPLLIIISFLLLSVSFLNELLCSCCTNQYCDDLKKGKRTEHNASNQMGCCIQRG